MSVRWIETTPEIYRAVYAKHGQDMHVFESYTSVEEDSQITAWGFKSADYATIKSVKRYGDWRYYIACPMKDDDE